ncbi:hypothetical protein SISSUDRAFT_990583, partial [Sistotremastrum suecicum HHB10207 ss-3]
QREYLAAKVLELGKLILRGVPDEAVSAAPAKPRSEGKRAEAAVKWFQKALWVVEKLDDADTPGVKDLKVEPLDVARSYFLSSSHNLENLTRAEATLHELVSSGDVSDKTVPAEFQQLRWMRVAVLKRKNVDDQALREAYQSIIDGMTFSEESVAECGFRRMRKTNLHLSSLLVTSVLQYCLKRSVELADDSGHPFAERLLLALILHCSRDQDTQRGMKDLELLWQCADRQYVAKNWISAAEWYLLATHGAFQSMAQISYSKCFRKAALCYVEAREFAMASTVLRRCPGEEAATHYVMFLAAAHQAISAIHDMVKCPDFNRDMLLLATQLAHESNMKSLLLAILQALLKTLQSQNGLADEVEAVTLIRCIIRLVLELLKEPAASIPALVEALIGHFQTALELCKKACSVNRASFILKDVSWLWRTAYNTAVSGCADWDDCELAVSNLFDVALDLMDIFSKESVAEPDVEMYGYKVYAAFAAISGKESNQARLHLSLLSLTFLQEALQKRILTDIAALRILIQGSEKKSDITSEDKIRFGDVLHACFVFEMELLCELQEWGKALTVIQNMSGKEWANLQLATFEAIADILWVAKSCPIPVLYQALEAIIHTCLDRNTLSIKKFSRWLRTICSFLLAHNTTSDRQKALNYMREAVALLEDNADADDSSGDAYPPDERQWLMSTSYNTGIECLSFVFC